MTADFQVALLVFLIVLAAIVIRNTSDYAPDNPVRLWSTRVAVTAILLWFIGGLVREIYFEHLSLRLVTSRSFTRGILAILVVWYAFRDEF